MPAPCRHRQVNAACSSRAVEGAVKNVILQRLQQRCCFGVATPAAQQRVEPCKCRSSPPQTCNYFDETEEANVYPIWQHCNISSQITWWCVALGAPAATAQASGVPLSHIATTIGSNSQNSCRKRQIRQSMRTFRQCRLPMFVASCFLRPPCPPPSFHDSLRSSARPWQTSTWHKTCRSRSGLCVHTPSLCNGPGASNSLSRVSLGLQVNPSPMQNRCKYVCSLTSRAKCGIFGDASSETSVTTHLSLTWKQILELQNTNETFQQSHSIVSVISLSFSVCRCAGLALSQTCPQFTEMSPHHSAHNG